MRGSDMRGSTVKTQQAMQYRLAYTKLLTHHALFKVIINRVDSQSVLCEVFICASQNVHHPHILTVSIY